MRGKVIVETSLYASFTALLSMPSGLESAGVYRQSVAQAFRGFPATGDQQFRHLVQTQLSRGRI